ncbi:hypothetical protein F5984_10650 [Rudanella paleaurantiibacter]|uniref:Uncharacterized protein n=1 Tax=Rudanella paleaurantiibacter TaxID=2614655 RepID=A0A7J5U0H0_9BACT|nr:hypothetical protein [Rudanella paleaurantiibacter]KAB7731252.1 hypothetical protein F5984_10650 [Rudanella paleaurantiibacter]
MADSSALSDGAQQANMVSNENAETMFGADQAETNMVKLVDGKLTPIGDTNDDVMDEQLRNRYSSDEERSLQGYDQKTYENSDAALRTGNTIDPDQMPDNPHAEAEITGNPDAGATVNTGLPAQEANTASGATDSTPTDRVQPNGSDMNNTATSSFGVFADMVPPSPSTPDPNNPVPAGPDTPTPPMSPDPAPEITPLPGQPQPHQPEIQEPTEPDRSHQIGFQQRSTHVTGWPAASELSYTATIEPRPADQLPLSTDDLEPGEAMPGNQYDGMEAGPDAVSADEGMDRHPTTGDSTHPYDVKGEEDSSYQPGERPQETAQMMSQPRESMDESSVKAQEAAHGDRSDHKSTEGLDRKYNDLDAARDRTAY